MNAGALATPSPSDILATRQSSLQRLTTLLQLAEGAWAVALYEHGAVRNAVIDELRSAVDPTPLFAISLINNEPDPHSIVSALADQCDGPAIIALTGISSVLPLLAARLDLQREMLAQTPFSLLLWMSAPEWRQFTHDAPNFYSRVSAVFPFPGTSTGTSSLSPSQVMVPPRPEPRPTRNLTEHRQRVAYLERRVADLEHLPTTGPETLAEAFAELGKMYADDEPYRWVDAEVAYSQAALAYAEARQPAAEADMRYRAGVAAYRGYAQDAARDHVARALPSYCAIGARLGEANTLASLAHVEVDLGEDERSGLHLAAAEAIFTAIGSGYGLAVIHANQGWAYRRADRIQESVHVFAEAAAAYAAIGFAEKEAQYRALATDETQDES